MSLGYDIRPIDLSDPKNEAQVLRFLETGFIDPKSFKVSTNTTSQFSDPTCYLAAFEGDKIIGFNAFVSHDFFYKGEVLNAFESSWLMSHSAYRGKKIAVNLYNEGQRMFKAQKKAFMFAFCNNRSEPVLLNKCGFRKTPMSKVNIPAYSFLNKSFLKQWKREDYLYFDNVISQSNEQLIRLKKAQYGEEIKVLNMDNNLIWGKIRFRKIGPLTVSYFDIGGMNINRPSTFQETFQKLCDQFPVHYVQFVSYLNNPYNKLFPTMAIAPHTEPLVHYDMEIEFNDDLMLNLTTGIRDAF